MGLYRLRIHSLKNGFEKRYVPPEEYMILLSASRDMMRRMELVGIPTCDTNSIEYGLADGLPAKARRTADCPAVSLSYMAPYPPSSRLKIKSSAADMPSNDISAPSVDVSHIASQSSCTSPDTPSAKSMILATTGWEILRLPFSKRAVMNLENSTRSISPTENVSADL